MDPEIAAPETVAPEVPAAAPAPDARPSRASAQKAAAAWAEGAEEAAAAEAGAGAKRSRSGAPAKAAGGGGGRAPKPPRDTVISFKLVGGMGKNVDDGKSDGTLTVSMRIDAIKLNDLKTEARKVFGKYAQHAYGTITHAASGKAATTSNIVDGCELRVNYSFRPGNLAALQGGGGGGASKRKKKADEDDEEAEAEAEAEADE